MSNEGGFRGGADYFEAQISSPSRIAGSGTPSSLYLWFKINGGGWNVYFVVIFTDPPAAYFDPPFINFSNFRRDYKKFIDVS